MWRLQMRNLKRLVHMQITRFSVGTDAPIIVNAIGYVGILLDFRNHNALANRMNGSCCDKEGITLVYRNRIQNFIQRVVFNMLPEFFFGDGLFQAII